VVGVLVLVIIAFLWCKRRTRAGEGDFELIVPGARTLVGYPDEIAELKVGDPEKVEELPLEAFENNERIIIKGWISVNGSRAGRYIRSEIEFIY
jgi:hypothetical protein